MFRFKQFAIRQDRCAMKVGTDGVLVGAWAGARPTDRRILDIGTGTGLIALMMAQRVPEASITGIDVADVSQARENAGSSPWSDRIAFERCAVQEYAPGCRFDLIVSNPPFFVDSLTCPDAARTTARHTVSLTFEALRDAVLRLLAPGGRFALILPMIEAARFEELCRDAFSLRRRTAVRTTPRRAPKRMLLEFSLSAVEGTAHPATAVPSPELKPSPAAFPSVAPTPPSASDSASGLVPSVSAAFPSVAPTPPSASDSASGLVPSVSAAFPSAPTPPSALDSPSGPVASAASVPSSAASVSALSSDPTSASPDPADSFFGLPTSVNSASPAAAVPSAAVPSAAAPCAAPPLTVPPASNSCAELTPSAAVPLAAAPPVAIPSAAPSAAAFAPTADTIPELSELVIGTGEHESYTPEYRALTCDFYLKF